MNLTTDNPAPSATDNPLGASALNAEPTATPSGTGNPSGQAQGGAPADDLFKGVDPNKLPPEVKAHYDSMLRDYRDKTTKLSETIKTEVSKASESYRTKAEQYDQIAAQEEFVRQWNEYVQKATTQTQAGQDPNADPAMAQMKAQLQEMNQKIQLSEMNQVTEAFADAVNEKGEKLHPEFDQFNGFTLGSIQNGGAKENFSLLRACVELAPGGSPHEKLANGYKAAKATYDTIFEAGKKAGMGRLQAKVMNGSLPPSASSGDVISVTDKRPKNAGEALAMARRGQMVSRE